MMFHSRLPLIVALLLVAFGSTSATVYNPAQCADRCGPSDFIGELPQEGPDNGDNRAYAWSIVALNQIRKNLGTLTPPGAARICGVVGSCLYEAASLVKKHSNSFHKKEESYKSTSSGFVFTSASVSFSGYGDDDNEELLFNTMDGAAFWALKAVFGNRASFSDVFEQYERFSGKSLEKMTPKLDVLSSKSYAKLTKGFGNSASRTFAFIAGAAACRKVVAKYTEDGFLPDGTLGGQPEPTGYTPINAPQKLAGITDCDAEIVDFNFWQPLCVPNNAGGFGTEHCTVQQFLAPWAGRFTPFALVEGDETTGKDLVGAPPAAGTPEFAKQANEVLKFSADLEDVGKIIAEFWADGPDSTAPPGHWWKIAADAAIDDDLDTAETARLLYIVGNAMYDAGIAAWRTKTSYDFTRPLQMIQCGEKRGQIDLAWKGPYRGVGLTNISEWRPYQASTFVTPGFAACVSGHSTFSSAAAEALRLFFGGDTYRGPACHLTKEGESLFEPKSNEIPGVTDIPNTGPDTIGYVPNDDVVLCWDTFTAAADEAGLSRLFGGIHVRADDDLGQGLGRKIGRDAFAKAQYLSAPSDF